MESSKSSGFKTADDLICTQECLLTGVQLYTDGTSAATLVLYDAQNASGKVVFKAIANAEAGGGSGSTYLSKNFSFPVECNSLYATITAQANAEYCIEYIK